jgi:uncharacterized protein YbaR (Trm112 family)
VRITLKKAYTDGTVAVDMDPLSLLCRLATSVPPPRFHTVRYAGVLAAASPWRPKIAPKPPPEEPAAVSAEPDRTGPAGGYRPWAELLARTFAVDVLACPKCHGRMRLLAMVEEPTNVARFLAAMGGHELAHLVQLARVLAREKQVRHSTMILLSCFEPLAS